MRSKSSRFAKTLILGLGNILCSDEGIGPHLIKYLQESCKLPRGVTALDGGTAGLALVPYLEGVSRLIAIDAIDAGARPGTIYKFSPDDLSYDIPTKLGAHHVEFLEVLRVAASLGIDPVTTIIAIQPASIKAGLKLSSSIKRKLPRLAELVMGEL